LVLVEQVNQPQTKTASMVKILFLVALLRTAEVVGERQDHRVIRVTVVRVVVLVLVLEEAQVVLEQQIKVLLEVLVMLHRAVTLVVVEEQEQLVPIPFLQPLQVQVEMVSLQI
jgi:hypothetical protein